MENTKLHRKTKRLLFDLQNICTDAGDNEEALVELRGRMEGVIPSTGGLRAIKELVKEDTDQKLVKPWALNHRIHEQSDPAGLTGKVKYIYMIAAYMRRTDAGAAMDREMRSLRSSSADELAGNAEKARLLWEKTPMRLQ